MTQDSSPSLGLRFRKGEAAALSEVYHRYHRRLFAVALKLLGDRDQAADAVQRAFVQAWRSASSFDESRDLQPWLYSITRRASIDVYRRSKQPAEHSPLDQMAEDAASVDPPSAVRAWEAWQVRRAMQQITKDERNIIFLAYFGGMSQSEISKFLNIPLGTVKSRSNRAQRRLGELLSHLDAS